MPQPARGLPPRIYVPIVVLAAVVFLTTIAYFLRIGLGVTGAALGPTAGGPAARTGARGDGGAVPPVPTRAAGEATVAQSGGPPVSGHGALPPGAPVGGGGPAAGGPPPQVAQALGALRERVRANPTDRDALIQLGTMYADAGKLTEASMWYARAVALKPDDATTRTAYAEVLQGAGKTQLALDQLHIVVRAQPDDARALFDAGAIAADHGRRAEAIASFRRFLRVAPHDSRAEEARTALRNLGAS